MSTFRDPHAVPLRFKVGDRVVCNTAEGWLPGTVTQLDYREDEWPATKRSAPYQVELDVEVLIFAPDDTPELVRAEADAPPAGAPWHVRLGQQMRRADIAAEYPKIAKHPHLFTQSDAFVGVDDWFVPELRAALAPWHESGDASTIDPSAIPDLRLEAPGVVSFRCLEPAFCAQLLEEAKHYTASGMPQRAPNTMNNYGVVLNEVGMRPAFDLMLRRYCAGLGALFFGELPPPVAAAGFDDWGGATLSDHHTFIVRYAPEEDRHLDLHVDECDVTFNFGLSAPDGFAGSDLVFCGMFGAPDHRCHSHTYAHVQGRCVLHSGKRRHGALDISRGERASLIMWTKSPAFRRTAAYQRKWGRHAEIAEEAPGGPDRVCLSYTHDRDFERLRHRLGDAAGVAPPE